MNCLVAVINGFDLFSTGMRIPTLNFSAPVNMVCVIMSCLEIDIESLSAVHKNMYSKKKSISSGIWTQIISL